MAAHVFAYLPGLRLSDHSLTHGSGFQGLVESKSMDVAVRTDAFHTGEVFGFSTDLQLRLHACSLRGGVSSFTRVVDSHT